MVRPSKEAHAAIGIADTSPHAVWVSVLGQDTSVTAAGGRLVRARVSIPAEHVELGPIGPRFHVVDYDATTDSLTGPWPLGSTPSREGPDPFDGSSDEELVTSRAFRGHDVYAVAARTLATFEQALGRRIPWAFAGHQVYLVPDAFLEANAYYDRDANALLFGYFPRGAGQTVHLSLSYDIVAHETTHAILDGLRSRFLEPGLPDQLAFHEAFADVVALLSTFSMPEVVEMALGPQVVSGRIPATNVSGSALRASVLFGMAEEFGVAVGDRRASLRRSIELEPGDVAGWQADPAFLEPHRRGEVFVAAVTRSFLRMWQARLVALESEGRTLNLGRAAEEGGKSAEHLLTMLIRAIDWLPPVEFEYEDFLAALIGADAAVAPDDGRGYRTDVVASFADFGISIGHSLDGRDDLASLDYTALNAAEFRARRDEAFRFIWTNASVLGLSRGLYTYVDAVLSTTRIGPDGLFVPETTIVYRQMLNGTADDIRHFSRARFKLPAGLDPGTQLQLHGGGVIVTDEFGHAKAHHHKDLRDWDRQRRRVEHLLALRLFDRSGRLGFSTGIPDSDRFAVLHASPERVLEAW